MEEEADEEDKFGKFSYTIFSTLLLLLSMSVPNTVLSTSWLTNSKAQMSSWGANSRLASQ